VNRAAQGAPKDRFVSPTRNSKATECTQLTSPQPLSQCRNHQLRRNQRDPLRAGSQHPNLAKASSSGDAHEAQFTASAGRIC